MVLLNGVDWEQFKKIIGLCDCDSDKIIFPSKPLFNELGFPSSSGRFLYNSEIDIEFDDAIFAYKRCDNVIEWYLSNMPILDNIVDDIEIQTNEMLMWCDAINNLIRVISEWGNDDKPLTNDEIITLVLIRKQLENHIQLLNPCGTCERVNPNCENRK